MLPQADTRSRNHNCYLCPSLSLSFTHTHSRTCPAGGQSLSRAPNWKIPMNRVWNLIATNRFDVGRGMREARSGKGVVSRILRITVVCFCCCCCSSLLLLVLVHTFNGRFYCYRFFAEIAVVVVVVVAVACVCTFAAVTHFHFRCLTCSTNVHRTHSYL